MLLRRDLESIVKFSVMPTGSPHKVHRTDIEDL
jgi:hypothetical protein